MKMENYFVGLDIGTDSVGYAVTDEQYNLCKNKSEPMWGVTLFDEAELCAKRRGFRSARRRLDRRQQRVSLIMELFANEIAKVDPEFYTRIKQSYLFPENGEQKVRLFKTIEEQKAYLKEFPTIHHLIVELMKSKEKHDARLVYIACAWLVAHRGHFLSDVEKDNIEAVTDFKSVYDELTAFIKRDEYALPWKEDIEISQVQDVLKKKLGSSKKTKELSDVLFEGKKVPKQINEEYEYNYELVIKLLCGATVKLDALFGKYEYAELEEKSVALDMDDEKLAGIMQSIGDDAQLIMKLKAVYDWSVLVEALKGKSSISEAKIEVYNQHGQDLDELQYLVRKYIPKKYNEIFRSETVSNNYVAFIGKNKVANEKHKVKKCNKKEEFCKFIHSIIKDIIPDSSDCEIYEKMMARLEVNDFMPKQVNGDNRVIPYQLYWYELNKILENAKDYIPFLSEKDGDQISGAEKVLSVFSFRVPYYVGPLKEKSNPKYNHWMVRKASGRIYPWNFEKMVDLNASEDAFIRRMTNTCTYLPSEDVLPKNSLLYSTFEVLNEINNIKINGNDIDLKIKQEIYENVFMNHDRVTVKRIKDYLESNNYVKKGEYTLTGLDETVKSSLKSHRSFRNLLNSGALNKNDVESIILHAACSDDRRRYSEWLRREYSVLSEEDIKYISNLKFKEFGRLSKKLLAGIEGTNKDTGEVFTIIRAMWETNCNFMELCSSRFTFADQIKEIAEEYYGATKKSVTERLDEMYVSNAVKRPIIRTIEILKDIVKVKGQEPKMIFIEMARGGKEDEKGNRTKTRLDQLKELYKKIDDEEIPTLQKQLDEWGDTAHNMLQSDKIFLYFIQLGKCLYTANPIDIESVIRGDGKYNIDHIYPRSFIKDDSVINNKVLVESNANEAKGDKYPVDPKIQENMRGYWKKLNKLQLISDEKYKRLTRNTHFTEEEKFEFVNRQIVETRQSAKAVATILKELYPNTEIVYVKAKIVSDFRQKFDILKSREVNDLHHAKDAYLNIVVGNVWHHKFSRQFWKPEDSNAKPEIIFTRPVICKGKTIWNGASDKDKAIKIAKKNTAHMTMYSYCKHSGQNGGFFDQKPLKASDNLLDLKKDKPAEIYGGYNGATITGFVLVRYKIKSKNEVTFVPIKLIDSKEFLKNDTFAIEYISKELGEKATDIEILFKKRILKNYAMLSLDGARFAIRGKAGLSDIGLMNMMPFMTSFEYERYVKKLESFNEKCKKNANIVWNEKRDEISCLKNAELYKHYIDKLSKWPYCKRPGNGIFIEKLKLHIESFKNLDIKAQTYTLLQIQGILGRRKQADLKFLKESVSSGIAKMSINLSNWKKNYTDVRIIDSSPSGLFESVSENLLDLL